MGKVRITVGSFVYEAKWEEQRAPRTCAAFQAILPFESKLIHARWSGEACWIPMGDRSFGIGWEDPTSHPAPGELLFYPGSYSETEILLPYGAATFRSKVGQLAGNHFLTIVNGKEQLIEMGEKILWQGALTIRID